MCRPGRVSFRPRCPLVLFINIGARHGSASRRFALHDYGAGWVTVFWSSVTPVWASSLPSIEAPVFMSIDV
jgi:hypothetical protein